MNTSEMFFIEGATALPSKPWTRNTRDFLVTMLLGLFSTLCCCSELSARTWQGGDEDEVASVEDKWGESLPAAIKQARVKNQYVLVKFHAEWCEPCKQLSKLIDNAEFDTAAKDYIRVSIDIDQADEVAKKYDVDGIPTMLILDSRGRQVKRITGLESLEDLVKWASYLEDVDFGEEVDFLASRGTPTPTEVREVIKFLEKRDSTVQQLAIERLVAASKQSAVAVVDSFVDGKLATQLAAWEILKRWKAPLDDLDPWFPKSFTEERIERIRSWGKNAGEGLGTKQTEQEKLEEFQSAETEIVRYVAAEDDSIGSLGRLTRYGVDLLPVIYEKIRLSTTDQEKERLSVLRYWLVASNELRLQRPGVIIELGSNELDSRRQAAATLSEIAKSEDEALLMELFADSDSLIREMGLKTLNRIGTKSTSDALTRLLKDPDANVKAAVLKQLAEKPSSKMISVVGDYLKQETDNDLIVYALKFMKEAEDNKTIPYVLELVDAESWQVRAQVAEVLAKVDFDDISDEKLLDQVSESAFKLLTDSDGFVVSRALQGIPPAKTKKSIENLINIAKSKPDLAEQIVESINESNRNYTVYSGYGGASKSTSKVTPFLEELLTLDDSRLRRAGVKGLISADSNILKPRLKTLLTDDDSQVRIAAVDAVVSCMASYRSKIDAQNSMQDFGETDDIERPSSGLFDGMLSMLFGGGSRSKKAKENDDVPVVESNDEEASQLESSSAEAGTKDSDDEGPEESVSKSEVWLANWQGGRVEKEEWMQEAIVALLPMLDASDEEEQAKSAQALVLLGETEKALPLVKKNALNNEYWYEASTYALPWLPYEPRTDLYFQLIDDKQYQDSFGDVLENYSKVQSAKAAQNIWKQISLNSLGGQDAVTALSKAYFGDVNHYQSLKEQGVNKQTILDAVADARLLLDDPDPKKNVVALAFLYNTGHESVPGLAGNIAESTGNHQVQRMAIRVTLLKQEDGAEAKAIQFLKTADARSLSVVLRFLCIGKQSLSYIADDNDFYLYNDQHVSYSSSPDSVKVRIPKPPQGLQPTDIAKLADDKDVEIRGLVNYLQILMQETKDIDPLLEHFESLSEQDDDVARLVYEALSVIDDDSLASHLEDIYNKHAKNDQYFAGKFYWTIRPMSGKKVLKLRSRMRREIGIENLNSYR